MWNMMCDTSTFWVSVGVSMCAVLILMVAKSTKGWNLVASILLIALSILMAFALSSMIYAVDHAKALNGIQKIAAENEKNTAMFWLVIFPAIFGSIGVNLISNHLQPKAELE
jgi:predicted permease